MVMDMFMDMSLGMLMDTYIDVFINMFMAIDMDMKCSWTRTQVRTWTWTIHERRHGVGRGRSVDTGKDIHFLKCRSIFSTRVLDRYKTETMDSGMLKPELVFFMPTSKYV
jgi:hypothetical protein